MCEHCDESAGVARRRFLRTSLAGIALGGASAVGFGVTAAVAADDPYAAPGEPALPSSGFELNRSRAALVITDPQVDFLSPEGVTWGVVGESVEHHHTVQNIDRELWP